MVEQGFTDVALSEWLGWFLPANTPAEIVRNLNQIVREGLQAPSMIEGLANGGLEPRHMSPDQFRAQLQQDFDRWAAIVKSTGFTMTE